MELPEELQLDDAAARDENEATEENPFDLDAKDRQLPADIEEEDKKEETLEGEKPDEMSEDDATNEDINVEGTQLDQDMKDAQEERNDVEEAMDADDAEHEEKSEEEKGTVDTNVEESNLVEETPEPSVVPANKKDDPSSTPADPEHGKNKETPVPTQDEENPSKSDEQASGQVESKDGHGHEGKAVNKDMQQSSEMKRDIEDASRRPGETDLKRSLAENEAIKDQLKKLKTIDISDATSVSEEISEDDESTQNDAEVYQHIPSAEKKDALTIDNATKEQVDKQKGMEIEDGEKKENPKLDQDDAEEMEIDEVTPELEKGLEDVPKPDLIRGLPEDKKKRKRTQKNLEEDVEPELTEVEGNLVPTVSIQRPAESYSHTNLELLKEKMEAPVEKDVELITINDPLQGPSGSEAAALVEWHDLESRTISLSQELCEELRLILEPTQAARLKGDYKTGKRLNMRKVIPYIASGFRKDKIWLRRTQPSKREYEILLALDDSASMLDNQSKQV